MKRLMQTILFYSIITSHFITGSWFCSENQNYYINRDSICSSDESNKSPHNIEEFDLLIQCERDLTISLSKRNYEVQSLVQQEMKNCATHHECYQIQEKYKNTVTNEFSAVRNNLGKRFEEFNARIEPIIKQIARERKLKIILNSAALIYLDPEFDLTSEVISRLKKQYQESIANNTYKPLVCTIDKNEDDCFNKCLQKRNSEANGTENFDQL